MTIAVSKTLMTADELLAKAGALERCELIEGQLIMMSPAGGAHGEVTNRLAYHTTHWVMRHQLGIAYTAETGFRLETNPDTVRAPDIAFIAADRAEQARTEG